MKRETVTKLVLTLILTGMLAFAFNTQQAKCLATPPPTQWTKTYGGPEFDAATSVVQTSDGGYALAGATNSSGAGVLDAWLVKADVAGTMQWNKTYGGPEDDAAFHVIQTGDGGYALAGSSKSYGAGGQDFWLVKTDAAGNTQWNKTYGGTGDDSAASLVQTSDGGYALAGRTHSFGAGATDFWLVKTDAAGNTQWNKTYGGPEDDGGESLVQTSDGGYALAGETYSYGAGNFDFWLVKTDGAGTMQWNKTYGGAGIDVPLHVIQTSDGGYALAGYTGSYGAGGLDSWLVKTDPSGNMQWNRTYGGAGDDLTWSVVQTSEGGYGLAGQTNSYGAGGSDAWLVKADAAGTMQWNQTYGGPKDDAAISLIQTGDGGYAMAGYTSSYGAGSWDMWVIKVGPSPAQVIKARVEFEPETLNLKSKGKWITCFIELPKGYNASDIDVSTIMLNCTVPAASKFKVIWDCRHDKVMGLMVKFNRTQVEQFILNSIKVTGKWTTLKLTVTGSLKDGTQFQGTGGIRVIMPRAHHHPHNCHR
jgi:predicted secreted protein